METKEERINYIYNNSERILYKLYPINKIDEVKVVDETLIHALKEYLLSGSNSESYKAVIESKLKTRRKTCVTNDDLVRYYCTYEIIRILISYLKSANNKKDNERIIEVIRNFTRCIKDIEEPKIR